MRKVCVVTGSRAEYGLLRGVIAGLAAAPGITLQLAVTGMHLSPEFGSTWREIEADGFAIDARVETLLASDTATGNSKATGLGVIGFADAFERLAPDLVVILGDRFEILASAIAALLASIPIAHIHGGETTEGAFDEAIRHSITKMAHLHFVAAEPYRRRVIQLGESSERVYTVGGMGIDAIRSVLLLERDALAEALDFDLGDRFLVVTFHPPTAEPSAAASQMEELFAALDRIDPATRLLLTMPNADVGGRQLTTMIERFSARRPHTQSYSSLGQVRYMSALHHSHGVVGNSSSGLLEAPSLGIGTVNIGDRQTGRLKAASVIDCAPQRNAIGAALEKLFSSAFRDSLMGIQSPYGDGGASERVVAILRNHPLDGLLKKRFHDLSLSLADG